MYALVDCNNFFVSCERVFRPDLEGKAVVVLSNNDGCVVSRSNEAKAMGIKMGTPLFQLQRQVDSGALVAASSNYALYGDLSSRVMSVLADAFPKIEIYSIDEAYLILDGFTPERYLPMCKDLRARVRKWTGIPVSIGIAPTRTLAKMASHFAKRYSGYKGVCAIDSEEKRQKALSLTPISDVWGIGRRLAVRMEEYKIGTALDFTRRPGDWVKDRFNIPGYRVWSELQGVDCIQEEEKDRRRQSICTSRSFASMLESEEELVPIVSDYAAICAKQLRKDGSAAQEVTTFLYTNRFREDLSQYYPSATVRLPSSVSNTQEIVGAALQAFRTIYRSGYKYKKAGVVVSDICPDTSLQTSLFDEGRVLRERNDRISGLLDKINSAASGGARGSGAGKNLLRLAVQNEEDFASVMRSEHRSRLYSTSLSDIIEVK